MLSLVFQVAFEPRVIDGWRFRHVVRSGSTVARAVARRRLKGCKGPWYLSRLHPG